MALEKQDIDALIEYIQQDPALRQRVLLALLPQEFLALPAAVMRLSDAVESLTRAVQALSERVEKLEAIVLRHEERLTRIEQLQVQQSDLLAQQGERLSRLEELVAQQGERLSRLEELVAQQGERLKMLEESYADMRERFQQFVELTEARYREARETEERNEKRFRRLENLVSDLLGWRLEERYRTHAYSFFGWLLQNVQPVDYNSIDTRLRQYLSDEEIRYLTKADLLLRGYLRQRPEQEVYLTLEVSSVIDANDVDRALRRASLLQKAGLNSIPAVGGQSITPDARTLAQAQQVLIALDGNLQGADLEAED